MPQQLAGLVFFSHDVVNFKIKNNLQFTDFKTHRLNRRCWFNGSELGVVAVFSTTVDTKPNVQIYEKV